MSNPFDIKMDYDPARAKEYTRKNLIRVLELSMANESQKVNGENEYRTAMTHYKKLCPIFFNNSIFYEPERSFSISLDEKLETDKIVEMMAAKLAKPALAKEASEQDVSAKGVSEKEASEEEASEEEVSEREVTAKEVPEEAESESAKERFHILQFLHYVIMKNRRCRESKLSLSVYDCLQTPSARYLDLYSEMIREIWEKTSKEVRHFVYCGDTNEDLSVPFDHGRYYYSAHIPQTFIDLIAHSFIYSYVSNTELPINFDRQISLFLERMQEKETNHLRKPKITRNWDELLLRLVYAKFVYRETDLLWAYEKTKEIITRASKMETKYSNMLEENGREVVFEDDVYFALDNTTGKVKILNICDPLQYGNLDISDHVDVYFYEIGEYVKQHADEIAKKTFRVKKPTKLEKLQIVNRLPKILEFLKIEMKRYHHSDGLTKAKLISAYQVYFLSLPKSELTSSISLSTEEKTLKGSNRAKNTISAAYSYSNFKEPRYLQLICTWTNYRYIWNSAGSSLANQYVEIMIRSLKSILSVGYPYGMINYRRNAEGVLFSTIDTLISDSEGENYLDECISMLKDEGLICRPFCASESVSGGTLKIFGKFCKLFPLPLIVSIIASKLQIRKEDQQTLFVNLAAATGNAFCVRSPILTIRYDCHNKNYAFLDFGLI